MGIKGIAYYLESLQQGRKKGTYCENCGVGIGKNMIHKKAKKFKKFIVCESCKKDLEIEHKTKVQVWRYSLNNLIFNATWSEIRRDKKKCQN
jgi:hypothetical protein